MLISNNLKRIFNVCRTIDFLHSKKKINRENMNELTDLIEIHVQIYNIYS